MANPSSPTPMIQDGAQVPVPVQPPGLFALPPVPGGDVVQAQGGFGPATVAKRLRRGVGRSSSFSPSQYARVQALANEKASGSIQPFQFATKGPTGGADSSNPMVGFEVTKNFTEVRIDLPRPCDPSASSCASQAVVTTPTARQSASMLTEVLAFLPFCRCPLRSRE